ncbi:MAG: hypothetical protein J6K51_03025 [Clostridia bacterium]|nr:hypothetical protein [Clostridia bacterium]
MNQSPYMKGILTGMAMGALVGMIFDPIRSDRDNAHLKKKACRMMKAAGQIMDSFTGY